MASNMFFFLSAEVGNMKREGGIVQNADIQIDAQIVLPGQLITREVGYLRGHGTYELDGSLYASVSGIVERVNKLISVKPLKAKYPGEVGDVVVGRITQVLQKTWRIEVNGRQSASLQLSAINLPGGAQRRRTTADELNMRTIFVENDLISCEVQQVHSDGQLALHTRSAKYGKLTGGQLITVPSALMKRVKNHFYSFTFGVDVILGLNGNIWISQTIRDDTNYDLKDIRTETKAEITSISREKISRVRNCIQALASAFAPISPDTIMETYEESIDRGLSCSDILKPDNIYEVTQRARLRR
ncbi:hypothetical protein PROFUN_13374 [Planoprotostelium fungivorum]|uniref:S1 motif domain-containing protein n=1 Tax=Planoprotostelium fungivorum TaxID=1890364 RepID=A0A2P6MZQ9_9EUKA|nr:hypothetical protein PROFUN_13374 [Planoprotostelium fungivorum]